MDYNKALEAVKVLSTNKEKLEQLKAIIEKYEKMERENK